MGIVAHRSYDRIIVSGRIMDGGSTEVVDEEVSGVN
jgi:hypothetical protein